MLSLIRAPRHFLHSSRLFSRDFLPSARLLNWTLADQAVVSIVNLLTSVLLARYLGVEEFGTFTIAWMVILFVLSLQHAIINSPMMSIGPIQDKSDRSAYFGAVVFQQLLFCVVALTSLFILGQGLKWVTGDDSYGTVSLLLSIVIVPVLIQDFIRRYYFSVERPHAAFVNDAIRYGGQIVALVPLVVLRPQSANTPNVLILVAISAIVATVIGAITFGRIHLSKTHLVATLRQHWQFSSWLTLSACLQWMAVNVFFFVAAGVLGSRSVGALRATQSLMGTTHILYVGLENLVPVQAATRYHSGGTPALMSYLARVAWCGELITIIACLTVAVVPGFWINLVFGSDYSEFAYLLRWWAAVYCVTFLVLPLHAGVRAVQATRYIFLAFLVGAIIAVASAYPLIGSLGLVGAMTGLLAVRFAQVLLLRRGLGAQMALSRMEAV